MASGIIKQKRLRANFACQPCRKRKIRCDSIRPQCSNCVSRGTICDYVSPLAKALPEDELQALAAYAARRPQTPKTGPLCDTSTMPEQSLPLDETIQRSELDNGPGYASSINRSSTSELLRYDTWQVPAGNAAGPATVGSDSMTWTDGASSTSPVQPLQADSLNTRTTPWCNTRPYLGPPSRLLDRKLADGLVDAYFDRIHPFWPFIHEGSFRARYENTCAQLDTTANTYSSPWYALLNMVFAQGCEFCPGLSPDEIKSITLDTMKRAQDIMLSQVFKTACIETVQALLLLCHHLKTTLDLDKCRTWHQLLVQAVNSLELDSKPPNGASPVEEEVRKRVWWGCFHIDHSLSAKSGQPSLSDWTNKDVDLPLEVDDQYINSEILTPQQPVGVPSAISFFVSTIRLSQVVIEMLNDLYLRRDGKLNDGNIQRVSLTKQHQVLSETLRLEGYLKSWENSAPDHLTQELDERYNLSLQRQRKVFKIRYLHIRLLLHRPAFAVYFRGKDEDSFVRSVSAASARVCINCARETISLVSTWYPQQMLDSVRNSMHYVFTSMCVLMKAKSIKKEALLFLGDIIEEDVLEAGFEFLQSVSKNNNLAKRYLAILMQIKRDSARRTMTKTGGAYAAVPEQDDHPILNQNRLRPTLDMVIEDLDSREHTAIIVEENMTALEEELYGTRLRGEFCFFGNEYPLAFINW